MTTNPHIPDSVDAQAIESVERAVAQIKKGGIVILVDDEDRENEGDMVMAAEDARPQNITFMTMEARGLICTPMLGSDLDRLNLPMQVRKNTSEHHTAFTVTVDAAFGITTGISSADRSHTIRLLASEESTAANFVQPGHVFPLRYEEGGVLVRAGHTEGSIDLVRLSGKHLAAVVCEILNDDGTMARRPQLEEIAVKRDLPIVTIADVIAYRMSHEKLVERVAEARLPTEHGVFTAVAYRSYVDPAEHVAVFMGEIDDSEPVLVRVESECLTGHVFGSTRCDCGDQVNKALEMIAENGRGVLVYMRQEGRGIGLLNKLKAYELQDQGLDTVEANLRLGFPMDLRRYGVGAQILRDLGVRRFRLLTNNPKKVVGLEGFGLDMVEQLPIATPINDENRFYLTTKAEKMGHTLDIDTDMNGDLAGDSVPGGSAD
ncbi:MAG: bifunctional 3,4-dihydroxy-2-butanone-4-phosphate synthase/GTP cyclohydrolase II [Dehalococcoidia bacterium]|nr:bifunctional 3,4-dihydroxy-2-butanone-4-phosphate synthase/GTP cyclohydrolase II [Dehalococcoidia bacterium]